MKCVHPDCDEPRAERIEATYPGYCFTCHYWQSLADQDHDDPRAFIQNDDTGGAVHYIAGDRTDGPRHARGLYGDAFSVDLEDGGVLETVDLWYQGEIPSRWLHLFEGVPRGIIIGKELT
jgi:hypothetical protein